MSTYALFQELTEDDLIKAVCEVLVPRLSERLLLRAPGHCMRVANLDLALMIVLCNALRKACPNAQVYILGENGVDSETNEDSIFISSTKLVELRNPFPDGSQRLPFLVFLPANLHASAEDSFGISTFEEISVSDIYIELQTLILKRIPAPLREYIRHLFSILDMPRWPWADEVARVRFLLTATKNQIDGEALGASLYELGLVPDFQLFTDPPLMPNRIRRNVASMRILTYSDSTPRGRVLELGLSDRAVQRHLTNFLSWLGVVDPYGWTRQIVINKQYWDISFDKWKFVEEISSDKVSVQILSLGLPEVSENEEDERLEGLSGQRVLNPGQQNRFSVTFRIDPPPVRVLSLDHLTVQIVTKNGEPVGGARRINTRNWGPKKQEHTVQLDKLNRLEFEDGWHIVRILPWTKDEDPVPLESTLNELNPERRRINESEPFYVLGEGELIDLPQRAIPNAHSLEHALLHSQFRECSEQHDPREVKVLQVEWQKKSSKVRQHQELLEIKLKFGGKYHILVSSYLKELEQQILASPRGPVNWHWNLDMSSHDDTAPIISSATWPQSLAVESFLDAREKYFTTLCSHSLASEPITQAVDLCTIHEACLEYAEAYRDMLTDLAQKITQSRGNDQQRAIQALRIILAIDTVHTLVTDIRGYTKETMLIGPTHPLRALWHATWAHLGQDWLAALGRGPEEFIIPAREELLHSLTPLNIPVTLPCSDGRVFLAVDNITPFWSLYAPPGEEDPRGLLGEICSALGLPEPAISGETINAEALTIRISRYLLQHPYIRTLSLNIFNPGHATMIAQVLIQLQKEEVFASLRYDVRLFVSDTSAPGVGEALESLLTPNSATSTELTDAFSLPGLSHLFPKLSLAVYPLAAFNANPYNYRAHLSVLFDLFPAEEVGAGSNFNPVECASMHGLIQEFETRFLDNEEGTFWRRQPIHGRAHPLLESEDEEPDESVGLLAQLEQLLSGMIATVATSLPAFEQRPMIMFSLKTDQRELIHYVHDVSDWVITIDRNIGIEFFDHGRKSNRPDYLIDFTPGKMPGVEHQLIVTSRAILELEATLKPFLNRLGLPANQHEPALILAQLRALSGRLALKLISSSTQQMEALGLALARLFLMHQGALTNQLILPLDVHLDLFRSVKRVGEELGEAITLQRTDLALFDLDATKRSIRCNLVEVKCYNQVGSASAYAQLKENVNEQIKQSEEVLRRHFDPNRKQPDRPDRLFKIRELVTLLKFYLGCSERYDLLESNAASEARFLLATLEDGYTLEFSRSALIFDFEKTGLETETEQVIEFYRIGRDQIEALLQESFTFAPHSSPDEQSSRQDKRISRIPSAAFLAPERTRTISKESYAQHIAISKDEEQVAWRSPEAEEIGSHTPSQEKEYLEEQRVERFAAVDLPNETLHEHQDLMLEDGELNKDVEQNNTIEQPAASLLASVQKSGSTAKQTLDNNHANVLYDVMLGAQDTSPQYGLLGEIAGRKVALDLNQTHTISLFGVQGSGKSYTLGSIIEMACQHIPHVNVLPNPLATVIFHFSPTQDYKPEFTSMVQANADEAQVSLLQANYGAKPQSLQDVILLVPASKLEARRQEYPDLEVLPLTFAASELKAVHWKFLMGAVGSSSMYIRQVNLMMRKLREQLSLNALQDEVTHSALSDNLKGLALIRLQFAAEYIDDSHRLSDSIRPGRLIIVDIRDEYIEKDEALGLFVVLLQIFSEATYQGETFNKLVVFDEAHKYMESQDLVSGLIEVVREMRHKGTSILIASQDPPSVPVSLIELSSQIILHRCNSPTWIKHIQKANSSLDNLTPEKMSRLGAGEAYVWSSLASDEGFTRGAVKIRCRPRVTRHGGDTKTAVNFEV